jgi:hypothetical protein
MSDTSAAAKRRKGRSPSYPGISLPAAIERARMLYGLEGRHWAPVATILEHWGYAPKSGGGAVTLAALKKFGLMEDEGSGEDRRARLTDLAWQIVHDPNPGQAIRRAALMPPIYNELWQEIQATGGVLSDQNLRWKLKQRGFTDNGADEFVPPFRDTVAFANLSVSGTIDGQESDDDREDDDEPEDDQQDERPLRRRRKSRPGMKTVTFPLVDVGEIVIEGQFPMPEEAWAQFMAVLNALKPSMVGERPAEAEDE